ncbi:CDGSH iron-sulfur domain-containing protein [Thiofilum flexile]|uniref:CDGSH iron-sulfur domain-containing protein n=1 Tax=Thiofilum flexile TaxID=125627 RepID=UPI0009FFB1AA
MRNGYSVGKRRLVLYLDLSNRQALCRCGQSNNKPFCDGTHVAVKYQDGIS